MRYLVFITLHYIKPTLFIHKDLQSCSTHTQWTQLQGATQGRVSCSRTHRPRQPADWKTDLLTTHPQSEFKRVLWTERCETYLRLFCVLIWKCLIVFFNVPISLRPLSRNLFCVYRTARWIELLCLSLMYRATHNGPFKPHQRDLELSPKCCVLTGATSWYFLFDFVSLLNRRLILGAAVFALVHSLRHWNSRKQLVPLMYHHYIWVTALSTACLQKDKQKE